MNESMKHELQNTQNCNFKEEYFDKKKREETTQKIALASLVVCFVLILNFLCVVLCVCFLLSF